MSVQWFNTDNPVMRIILTRNCVTGNSEVGYMRAKSLIYDILYIVKSERKMCDMMGLLLI